MPTPRSTSPEPPTAGPSMAAGGVALLLLLTAPSAWAAEPLSAWLEGLGDAAAALDGGDAAGALAAARRARAALSDGPAGARAEASIGLALLAGGAPGPALAPLRAGLDGVAPEARPALQVALGRALLEAGQPAEALLLLEPVASATSVAGAAGLRARWLRAWALLATGRDLEGVAALEPLLRDRPDDPEALPARLRLAAGLRRLGQAGRALAQYRALAIEAPDRPEAAAALEALTTWGPGAPPGAVLSGVDRLARADRLLARGRHAEALLEVEAAAVATPPAEATAAALQRALVLLAQGRHVEAEALAAPLAAGEGAAGMRRSATWVLARAAARAGRFEEAAAAYGRVADGAGGLPGLPEARWGELADEARFLSAWLWYDAGRLEEGARRLDAFARARPASRRVDDARWFAAFARVRLREAPAARQALSRLERGPLADAALYWQGRLATTPAEAAACYRRAEAASPDGWYASLARARLASGGQAAAPVAEPEPLTPLVLGDGPGAGRLSVAAALLGLGWREGARLELEELLRRRTRSTVAAPLAELASFVGAADLAFRAARDQLGATRRSGRWLHPEPLPSLAALASAAGVDPDLLRAVVRRESGYRAEVRSAAGATGLTQLLPATASRLAALAGLADDPSARLADPETSVAIGAHYLGLLQDRFHQEAATLAAYNAGPVAVSAWADGRTGLPLDEWVETIPYRETRGYVKAVLLSRDAYRRLAGLPSAIDPAQPIQAPAEGASF